jgi:hypothetical protein
LFALFTEGKGLADLTRYFDLQTKWDNKQYGLLSEQDVIFMSEGRKRFTGDCIGTLYYQWNRNQLPKDLQIDQLQRPCPLGKFISERSLYRGMKGYSATVRGDGVTAGKYGVLQGLVHPGSHPQHQLKVFRERQMRKGRR